MTSWRPSHRLTSKVVSGSMASMRCSGLGKVRIAHARVVARLGTRLLTNGIQASLFSVLWKLFEDMFANKGL